jgi:hypothetical protein
MTECPICSDGLVATRWQRIKSVAVSVEHGFMVITDYDLDYNDDTTIECHNGHTEEDMVEKLKEGEAHVDREMSSV